MAFSAFWNAFSDPNRTRDVESTDRKRYTVSVDVYRSQMYSKRTEQLSLYLRLAISTSTRA